ncbi:MAG: undecaprenyl-diphosphate phosphatase [Candidatus Binatia bacterium]
MISIAQACFLGAVQGLTEFLPISSSGHLALVQHFQPGLSAEQKAAVDVALHAGTLVAVVAFFARDLWAMGASLLRPREDRVPRRWVWLLAAATVPAAAVGLPLHHEIEAAFDSMPLLGVCFLFTGVLLYLGSAVRGALRRERELALRDAITIGAFQALALLPGVSRSGATIVGGLFRRVAPDVAARFSFLLSIPAIVGALLVEGKTVRTLGPEAYGPVGIGIAVSGVTGFAAIWVLLRLVRQGRLHYFAYYAWMLGAVVLVGSGLGL